MVRIEVKRVFSVIVIAIVIVLFLLFVFVLPVSWLFRLLSLQAFLLVMVRVEVKGVVVGGDWKGTAQSLHTGKRNHDSIQKPKNTSHPTQN